MFNGIFGEDDFCDIYGNINEHTDNKSNKTNYLTLQFNCSIEGKREKLEPLNKYSSLLREISFKEFKFGEVNFKFAKAINDWNTKEYMEKLKHHTRDEINDLYLEKKNVIQVSTQMLQFGEISFHRNPDIKLDISIDNDCDNKDDDYSSSLIRLSIEYENAFKTYNENCGNNKINNDKKLNFEDHMEKVINIMNSNKYHKLLKFINFDIGILFAYNTITNFLKNCKDDDIIKYFIDNSIDLECENEKGSRLIHHVCEYCNSAIIKYLVDKNVDINCSDNKGWKPINFALKLSKEEATKILIEKDTKLEFKDSQNWAPIHLACRHSSPEIIKCIIDKGVDLESISSKNWKPFNFACRYSTPKIIKYLIQKGVDFNNISKGNTHPMNFILMHRYDEKNNKKYYHSFDSKDDQDILDLNPNINLTVFDDIEKLIIYLCELGANINCSTTGDKMNIIHYACQYSNVHMVRYLASRGANLELANKDKQTPLHYACKFGNLEMIKFLVEKGTNLKQKDLKGNNALHYVCKYGNFDSFKYVVDTIGDLESYNNLKKKAIHILCEHKNSKFVQYLCEKEIDIKSKDGDGFTPFLLACGYNEFTVIDYLMDNSDINIKETILNKYNDNINPVNFIMMNNKLSHASKDIIINKLSDSNYYSQDNYIIY